MAHSGPHVDDVHRTLPSQSEDYIHRIGRVGRAERTGLALSLVAAASVNLTDETCG